MGKESHTKSLLCAGALGITMGIASAAVAANYEFDTACAKTNCVLTQEQDDFIQEVGALGAIVGGAAGAALGDYLDKKKR